MVRIAPYSSASADYQRNLDRDYEQPPDEHLADVTRASRSCFTDHGVPAADGGASRERQDRAWLRHSGGELEVAGRGAEVTATRSLTGIPIQWSVPDRVISTRSTP